MRVASIDVGSNSLLMLVAERGENGHWERVEEHAEVARISEGLDQHGVLQEGPIGRALAVLRVFVDRARALEVDHIWVTGTAPFRRARNGLEVATLFEESLGVPFRVVSGDEEGALTLLATAASFPQFPRMCVLDIGGASTELLRWEDGVVESQSIDLGVVRLLERYVAHDPPTASELQALRKGIREELRASLTRPEGTWPLVGVAGTVTSLAALDLQLVEWDPVRVQGHRLARSSMEAQGQKLWGQTIEERCRECGVDPRRADVIAIGAWYLYELCVYLQVDEVLVSDRGLRWGRIFEEGEALS